MADPKRRRPSKRAVAIIAAAVIVLACGITVTSVSVANAAGLETARQCAVALKSGAAAAELAKPSLENADKALTTVKSIDLPGSEGWKSTSYADRPAATATATTPARPSGTILTSTVAIGRGNLANIVIRSGCETRDQAAAIAADAKKSTTASKTLDGNVSALLADFTAFQTAERTRVAAEVEAARVKVEAEEAARQAAAGSGSSGSRASSGSCPEELRKWRQRRVRFRQRSQYARSARRQSRLRRRWMPDLQRGRRDHQVLSQADWLIIHSTQARA